MPDLLLELRSEEIPARMQRKAAGDLKKMITDGLVEAGLTYEAAREYWTPRRLTLDIRGVTARSRDVREEIKGPSTKAPEQAVQGFLRKAGLSDVSEAHVHSDPKKGDFYVAHISKPGRAAEEVIAELVPATIRAFPWPKSMRWGKASAKPGALRWVRPLQSIVCTFGPETEEPVVVPFEVDGIVSGNVTFGHRFHAPGAITVRRFEDYVAKLEAAKVVLDAERRKEIIRADAQNLAFAAGLELVEDEGLLEEVSGLVEWPVVLMGQFEEDYLQIPAEVIRLTIRANQKCFVTRPTGAAPSSGPAGHLLPAGEKREQDVAAGTPPPLGEGVAAQQPGEGALAPRFLLTANIEASDGGADIARGNGKVVRARLSDALYFWRTDQANLPDLDLLKDSAEKFGLDLAKPLDQRMARLDHLGVTFHAKIGTQGERVRRIIALADKAALMLASRENLSETYRGISDEKLDSLTHIYKERVIRAALLAKADLQTEIVGEFPELQGSMGKEYAKRQGEESSVAEAIKEHYQPLGPNDRVSSDAVATAVAIADKVDTLVTFWAISEKPTGSKDPFALRRAALGVLRIVIENCKQIHLRILIEAAYQEWLLSSKKGIAIGSDGRHVFRRRDLWEDVKPPREYADAYRIYIGADFDSSFWGMQTEADAAAVPRDLLWPIGSCNFVVSDLLSFFHDRLKVYLRDKGARHDLIDAVISPEADDLLAIVRRVEALGALLDSDEGRNLLAGTKRAANILAAEEKKGTAVADAVNLALFRHPSETVLYDAVNHAEKTAAEAIGKQDFSAAMRALSALREPVDSFFEDVLVNDEDHAVRANRLALLARIRAATGQVADFSKIAG